MSNQQNSNAQVDDNVQGVQEIPKQRSRNFYRKRPGWKHCLAFLNYL